MDVGVAVIIAAIVGAIATLTVTWITARGGNGGPFALPAPNAPMSFATTPASSTTPATQRIPDTLVKICRGLIWGLIGLSYFLAFSGLTGASFSIGIVAVRAFASHAVSLTDTFVPQFAVLSAFGFFCGSVWRTVLGLLPQASRNASGQSPPVLQTEAR
jgi:hypothetical protein